MSSSLKILYSGFGICSSFVSGFLPKKVSAGSLSLTVSAKRSIFDFISNILRIMFFLRFSFSFDLLTFFFTPFFGFLMVVLFCLYFICFLMSYYLIQYIFKVLLCFLSFIDLNLFLFCYCLQS